MNAARAGIKRLRAVWFTLVQTSVAAGLSWYLAHDLLGHPQPFFAPIAAAVSLSVSNVLRAQRAIQMMVGVTLGIGVGTLVQALLGPGALAIAAAALIALFLAVFIGHGYIGQGMMFANQTAISAILVLALYRSNVGLERIYDALLGGAVAIVFAVLLFPADPLRVLRSARVGVLGVLQGVLTRAADFAAGRREVPPDWPLSAVDRVHQQLGGLIEARTTARHVVRIAPRRWGLRDAVRAADRQGVHVALLAGSVLELARAVAPGVDGCRARPVHGVLVVLAAATALADSDPAGACAYTASARHHASELHAGARERNQVVLADVVQACVDDLQRVIDLRSQ
ncbi:aromatic acid exporter family protein [Mycobacterium sp. 852002-50816_SCH5313054-b]|uniref:FUSC family protein n=1 Tax=Mycobacterium sp. 852002-50816_SCH5313054-b TaxID=1834092 RepID=UPI0009EF6970|nr:FUSC family protein [Mycobacterium sp. 852002-50816_SCH5313054-b]